MGQFFYERLQFFKIS